MTFSGGEVKARRGFLARMSVVPLLLGLFETVGAEASAELDILDFLTPEAIRALKDGRTDFDLGVQINNAIRAVSEKGGVLRFGPYRFCASNIVLCSNVILKGVGVGATEFYQISGSNRDFIVSDGFAAYAQARTGRKELAAAPRRFGLKDLRVCGNRKGNKVGRGLVLYGSAFTLAGVTVYECAGDGIHTQFSALAGSSSWEYQEEAEFASIVSRDNGGRGWVFWGPHNSRIDSYVGCYNGDYGFQSLPYDGKGGDGGVDYIGHMHTYANKNDKGVAFGAVCRVGTIITDGDNLDILSDDVQIGLYRGYNICGERDGLLVAGNRVYIGSLNLKIYKKTVSANAIVVRGSGVHLNSIALAAGDGDARFVLDGSDGLFGRLFVQGTGRSFVELVIGGYRNTVVANFVGCRFKVGFSDRSAKNRVDVLQSGGGRLEADGCGLNKAEGGNVCQLV